MKTGYGGIDLHANNRMIVILDGQGQVVFRKRVPNQLEKILPFFLLMGNWCDSGNGMDTATRENSDAVRGVRHNGAGEQSEKKKVQSERRRAPT